MHNGASLLARAVVSQPLQFSSGVPSGSLMMVPVVLQMYLMWPWLRHRAQMPMCEQRPRSASYSLQSKLLVNCQACCPLYGIGRILLFSFSRVSSAFPAGRLLQQPARLAVMPEMWQTFDASPDMSGQLPAADLVRCQWCRLPAGCFSGNQSCQPLHGPPTGSR